MQIRTTCLLACALASSMNSWAASPEGTWKFERSVDYFGRTPVNQAPKITTIVMRSEEVSLSEQCVARMSAEKYYFSDVFQPLTKQGISEKQLDSFLTKQFNLVLSKAATMYSLAATPTNCAGQMMEFFAVKDKILVPIGATFYLYAKSGPDQAASAAPAGSKPNATSVLGYKASRLPMKVERYLESCAPKILDTKGRPRTSDKCAPDFFPYVADPGSTDSLMKLVGNHDYAKGGQEHTSGFSPPFKQKVPATFLVFPPMKNVTLIRVDDLEVVRNDMRDVMSGVYLSIVDGRIVDQLYGCDFGPDYVCVADGRNVAKLTENGKFQKMY
ncbi:MAG: hypothetical protein WKG03_13200 [Telluria sp.]